ncbi:MAG: DUF4363 family protein [Clostridia bacterium]|nr:DUF4363 family protein [Clostridia bacterium]
MKGSVVFMIVGFIVIISVGWIQQTYLQKSSKKLLESVNALEILANHDKISEVDGKIVELTREWEKMSKIWKILVYHDEIQPIEETLVEVCADLGKKLEDSQISSKFELLKMYIKNVSENNQFILENIL